MPLVEARDHIDGVRLLTLNDPDRRNAISSDLRLELQAAVAGCEADGVRVLVITGAGSVFCAGANLPELFGDHTREVSDTHGALADYYRVFLDVLELPIPTIAALNGPAIGAGLNLALACDLRIAGRRASLEVTFAKIGLHPGGGVTWFLVRALGQSRALELLLLGETLDASQAVAAGFASGPAENPVADALDLATALSGIDPSLARQIKQTVRLAAAGASFEAVLAHETWAQAASARSQVLRAWVDRFR